MSGATEHMLPPQRRRAVLGQLRAQGTVHVTELAETLSISASTVRRDLAEMEQEGLLSRVHGGAVVLAGESEPLEPDQPHRSAERAEQKRRIGAAAAALVPNHGTVLISGGTTTEAMVGHLGDRQGLTVVTNSLPIAGTLARHPAVTVVVLGGLLRHLEQSLLGHLTEQALAEFQIDQVFTGAFGVDAEIGLTGAHVREAQTDRSLLHAGTRLAVLADSRKIGRRGPIRLAPVHRIGTLVTDAGPEAVPAGFADAGVRVITC